jgi:hypothetical protein
MGDTDEREMLHLLDGQWKVWHGFLLYTGRRYTLLFRQNLKSLSCGAASR